MRWYFIFFLVSGFCSLVYEVVWLRLAMAQFGVITPLVSVVLSVFMAGLGLGSWAAGRLIAGIRTETPGLPLRLYALIELLIGVAGLLVPRLLITGHALLLERGGGAGWGSPEYFLGATLWITLALLPACTCMGATFPLAMAAIEKSFRARAAQSFSYLYVANVLGAVLGTAVPAFVLIEALGFLGTSRVAVALNVLLAAAALGLSRATSSGVPVEATPAESRPTPQTSDTPAGNTLALLFTTGVVSLALEVVWIRLFTPYIGTVVYAFATILILYLLGTFLGSRWYRATSPAALPARAATAWVLAGVCAALALACADPRFGPPGFLRGVLRVMVGVAPFSAAVGFVTPMLVDRWSAGDPRRAGRAYAVNVLGAIVGPLVAGFALLPWLGERWSVALLTLPLLGLAWRATRARSAAPLSVRAALLLPLLLLLLARTYEEKFQPRQVRRDYAATVTAVGTGMEKRLLVNGTSMTVLTPITKMMAHLPLAFLPRPPRNALVIAFGMGTSHRSLLSWGIPATAVELIPSVPALFGYFHPDGPGLLASPRSRVVIDDGRRFLERSSEQFDVITIDPPPPVEAAGSSLLYSR